MFFLFFVSVSVSPRLLLSSRSPNTNQNHVCLPFSPFSFGHLGSWRYTSPQPLAAGKHSQTLSRLREGKQPEGYNTPPLRFSGIYLYSFSYTLHFSIFTKLYLPRHDKTPLSLPFQKHRAYFPTMSLRPQHFLIRPVAKMETASGTVTQTGRYRATHRRRRAARLARDRGRRGRPPGPRGERAGQRRGPSRAARASTACACISTAAPRPLWQEDRPRSVDRCSCCRASRRKSSSKRRTFAWPLLMLLT